MFTSQSTPMPLNLQFFADAGTGNNPVESPSADAGQGTGTGTGTGQGSGTSTKTGTDTSTGTGTTAAPDAGKAAGLDTGKAAGADGGKPSAQKPSPVNLGQMLKTDPTMKKQFDTMVDRITSDALKKAEAQRNMTAEQLAEQKAIEAADALSSREAALALRELRADAQGVLGERGLDPTLVDCLFHPITDAESMTGAVDRLDKAFRAAVNKAVKTQLAGNPPKSGSGAGAPAAGTVEAEIKSRMAKYQK